MGETTGGVLRRGPDRIIGGVGSGLATYFGVDPLLVRIIFVILALIPPGFGIGVLLYLALWFLMEPPQGAPTSATRNVGARLRMMSDEIREDFRTGFRTHPGGAATPPSPTGDPAGWPLPAGAPVSPASPGRWSAHGDRPRGLWLGIILIVIGAYFLIDNLGWFRLIHWEIVGPVILIAAGILFLARRR
jgi:phage shock protein PspC (stress-responsive transcriptional regulator)